MLRPTVTPISVIPKRHVQSSYSDMYVRLLEKRIERVTLLTWKLNHANDVAVITRDMENLKEIRCIEVTRRKSNTESREK